MLGTAAPKASGLCDWAVKMHRQYFELEEYSSKLNLSDKHVSWPATHAITVARGKGMEFAEGLSNRDP